MRTRRRCFGQENSRLKSDLPLVEGGYQKKIKSIIRNNFSKCNAYFSSNLGVFFQIFFFVGTPCILTAGCLDQPFWRNQ